MYDSIKTSAEALSGELIALRRDFHKYAEPGWLEMRTTSIIAGKLSALGYDVLLGQDVCKADARMGMPENGALAQHYTLACANGAEAEFLPYTKGGFTGAIATLRCGEGPTVALRFDIDALGVSECRDAAHFPSREGFASVTEGVMHACGHDGHAAIGLGVAKLLMQQRAKLHGTVKLIFQPAEEGVRGARSIVEAGHLDDVDFVLAAHVFPVGTAEGFHVAVLKEGVPAGLATSKLDVHFKGKPAHAGISPQEGHNALLAAATAVINMHAIPRFANTPTQINVGKLTAGSGRNVICESAVLELEVRGATTEANDYMEAYAIRIAENAAAMHGCACTVKRVGSAAALTCDGALYNKISSACGKLGLRVITSPCLGGGSEDFAYMADRVQRRGGQAAYVGLLSACPAPNHSDRFDFDEGTMICGVEMFMGTLFELLA